MAHETRGNLSEAVIILALEQVGFSRQSIYWGETPSSLKVCQSDVTIGESVDSPHTIFQVCSSGYSGGYQKKFWRDMGELIEIRRVYPQARLISAIFEPGIKPKLRQIYDLVSDGTIDVSDMVYGPELLAQIKVLAASSLPRTQEERLKFLESRLSRKGLKELGRVIRDTCSRRLGVWEINHLPTEAPNIVDRKLNVRKAILVSALFSSNGSMRNAAPFLETAEKRKVLPNAGFLQALADLNICQRTIRGYVLKDRDLLGSLEEVGAEAFLNIATSSIISNPDTRVFSYVELIQNLPELIGPWFEAICEHYDDLCSDDGLSQAIVKNYANYGLWLPDHLKYKAEPWLFRRLLDLVRAADQKHFAIGIPRFDPVFKDAGLPALRFTISDYVAGRRPLSQDEARAAASVLVPELQRIRAKVRPNLLNEFRDKVRRSEFQQRLLTYRGFDPLPVILAERFGLVEQTIVPDIVRSHGIAGAGTSTGYLRDEAIYMWQSASKKGVAHKVKELVGRMGLCCLEMSTLPDGTKVFTINREFQQRVLYVDGAWGKRELEAVLAGIFTCVKRVF